MHSLCRWAYPFWVPAAQAKRLLPTAVLPKAHCRLRPSPQAILKPGKMALLVMSRMRDNAGGAVSSAPIVPEEVGEDNIAAEIADRVERRRERQIIEERDADEEPVPVPVDPFYHSLTKRRGGATPGLTVFGPDTDQRRRRDRDDREKAYRINPPEHTGQARLPK